MNIARIGVFSLEWTVTGAGCTEVDGQIFVSGTSKAMTTLILPLLPLNFCVIEFLCNLIYMISLFKAQCTVTMMLESGDLLCDEGEPSCCTELQEIMFLCIIRCRHKPQHVLCTDQVFSMV